MTLNKPEMTEPKEEPKQENYLFGQNDFNGADDVYPYKYRKYINSSNQISKESVKNGKKEPKERFWSWISFTRH